MRILVLGENNSAKLFYERFKTNQENIVFTTIKDEIGYFEFLKGNEIVEFCLANEIDLVLITQEKYILSGVEQKLNESGICVFAPDKKVVKTIISNSDVKKFIYKNKINTPKFFVAQKPQFAFDYMKENYFPFALKPERNSFFETIKFVQTRKEAKKVVNDLFAAGNEKIVVEDYVEGKNIEVWTISNGFSAKIIGINAKYQNEAAFLKPNLIKEDVVEQIYETIINPIIASFSKMESEYLGILGFDLIFGYDGNIYLMGLNYFYDEISAPLYIDCYDWEKIMYDTVVGDVFIKNDLKLQDSYKISYIQNNEFQIIEASTKNNLLRYIEEMEIEQDNVSEILKIFR